MIKKALFLLFSATFCLKLFPQNKAIQQQTFLETEYFLMKGGDPDALPIYQQLYEELPDNL